MADMSQSPITIARVASALSMAVVFFALEANSTHDYIVADNFEQNDISRSAERHDQLTRTPVAQVRLAARVWRPGQQTHSLPDRVECALGRRPIRYFARELPLDSETLQALKVNNCLFEQLDSVNRGHLPAR
jgi:hypothetical protein